MAKMSKFYVVWHGRETGIFNDWKSCQKQIDGFEAAQFKSFSTKSEAENAFKKSYFSAVSKSNKSEIISKSPQITTALVVDAAWNTKTGDMEYQGFKLHTGKLLFKQGPFRDGTNNIGEFLAIVHALAFLKKKEIDWPIYTDSKTAMSWIKNKKANTKLTETTSNKELFELIVRAENWLNANKFTNKVLKWETKIWGENPADFGRK